MDKAQKAENPVSSWFLEISLTHTVKERAFTFFTEEGTGDKVQGLLKPVVSQEIRPSRPHEPGLPKTWSLRTDTRTRTGRAGRGLRVLSSRTEQTREEDAQAFLNSVCVSVQDVALSL